MIKNIFKILLLASSIFLFSCAEESKEEEKEATKKPEYEDVWGEKTSEEEKKEWNISW